MEQKPAVRRDSLWAEMNEAIEMFSLATAARPWENKVGKI